MPTLARPLSAPRDPYPYRLILIVVLLFLNFTACCYASDVINTVDSVGSTETSSVSNSEDIASRWQLSETEWQRYQQLMQGVSGKCYQALTPLEVLGINAENATEQRHFAELVAKQEHDRLVRELSFDKSFHDAMQRLYVNEPIIAPFDLSAFNPDQE